MKHSEYVQPLLVPLYLQVGTNGLLENFGFVLYLQQHVQKKPQDLKDEALTSCCSAAEEVQEGGEGGGGQGAPRPGRQEPEGHRPLVGREGRDGEGENRCALPARLSRV